MARIYLGVPFSEKDQAKALGARWDAQRRQWYVFEDHDLGLFDRWVFPEPPFHVRSSFYYVAETTVACFHKRCGKTTRVYAALLPTDCEVWQAYNDDGTGWWIPLECSTFMSNAIDFAPAVVGVLRELAPTYRPDFSKSTKDTYWMNHCEHCGAKQGDWYLHDEPGGFLAMDLESAARIMLHPVREVFEGNGGISQDSGGGADLLDYMTVIP